METHAAMVDRVDQGIGKIIDKLKKNGQMNNTLILFFLIMEHLLNVVIHRALTDPNI